MGRREDGEDLGISKNQENRINVEGAFFLFNEIRKESDYIPERGVEGEKRGWALRGQKR